jgi:hypothetical protein
MVGRTELWKNEAYGKIIFNEMDKKYYNKIVETEMSSPYGISFVMYLTAMSVS